MFSKWPRTHDAKAGVIQHCQEVQSFALQPYALITSHALVISGRLVY